jgi:hypothetical protein
MNTRMNLMMVMITCSIFFVSCKKDGDDATAPGPDILLSNDGFLCTYKGDTLRYITSGVRTVITYVYGDGRKSDEVSFETNGDNTVSIKLKVPYTAGGRNNNYFRIQKNSSPSASSFPNNLYLFNWQEGVSNETDFIVKRKDTDKTKFTLESKAYPGYFLSTEKGKGELGITDTHIVFTTRQQEFFFMAK